MQNFKNITTREVDENQSLDSPGSNKLHANILFKYFSEKERVEKYLSRKWYLKDV